MKYFIYGSRSSGKTTHVLNLLQKMDYDIVWETLYSRRKEYSRLLGGRKIHTINKGLRNYVRVYDNIENHFDRVKDINSLRIFNPILTEVEVKQLTIKNYLTDLDLFGSHTIVTCTPDNNEDTPNTPSYILYKLAMEAPHWTVINLGGLDKSIYHPKEEVNRFYYSLPESIRLGAVLGEWYDKDKAEMEKKTKEKDYKFL